MAHGTEIVSFINVYYYDTATPSQHSVLGTIYKPILNWSSSGVDTANRLAYLRSMCYNALPRMLIMNPTLTVDYSSETVQITVNCPTPNQLFSIGDMDHVIYIDNDMLNR